MSKHDALLAAALLFLVFELALRLLQRRFGKWWDRRDD
jgi:hypothetical protein